MSADMLPRYSHWLWGWVLPASSPLHTHLLWPPAPCSQWKTLTLRVGLRGAGGGPGASACVAGVVLVLGWFTGLKCSPSRCVSLSRLTARSTWSTCPASRLVMLSQLLRCKVSPGAGMDSAHVWWDCHPTGPPAQCMCYSLPAPLEALRSGVGSVPWNQCFPLHLCLHNSFTEVSVTSPGSGQIFQVFRQLINCCLFWPLGFY